MTPEEIAHLHSTNYKALISTRILVGTAVVSALAFMLELARDHDGVAQNIYDSWLLFLAAVLGIGAGQYASKRFSDKGYVAAKAKRGAPAQVVTSAGGPVVAAATNEAARPQPTGDAREDDERGEP